MALVHLAAAGRLFATIGRGKSARWYQLQVAPAGARSFFFGRGGDGGDGKGGGDDKKDKKPKEQDKETETEEEVELSTELMVSAKDGVPERLPIGACRPLYPHSLRAHDRRRFGAGRAMPAEKSCG